MASDYFNETYLPGYDNNGEITNVQEMEITLSEDDYSAIAKNSANKAIAEAAGEEAVAALSAIGKNNYFASQDEAATYVPGWLAAHGREKNSSRISPINIDFVRRIVCYCCVICPSPTANRR